MIIVELLKRIICNPKPKFSPDLIDLVAYEKELLYAREHDRKPIPIKPWPRRTLVISPSNHSDWTEAELQYMRDNREQAKTIKERIFPNED
jgi:hypothetical protein